MVVVVVASNVLVQYPVEARIGSLDLADLLTWGAFSYPAAFLVTDLTNRRFGVGVARRVVVAGFAVAIVLSMALAGPRIAVASASAFLIGQLLDVTVFDRLRRAVGWWKAPFVGSLLGSATDTAVFFSLAFASLFQVLGAADAFAGETAPLFGLMAAEAPRWISWAIADFTVKLGFAALFLVPYRLLMNVLWPIADRSAAA
ncbi:VUT family protein [Siculibacillus lacustris]|uniref:VUT family protein n=1 Tax=Siculibacillus lacustris TaxID=1549641 RepID=A0A4Q9VW06_9HYPH|nr:VUT family protein [Siculibacillus lacustris]TBW40466.1 VUT family protein [Siculibacillus lacustris]